MSTVLIAAQAWLALNCTELWRTSLPKLPPGEWAVEVTSHYGTDEINKLEARALKCQEAEANLRRAVRAAERK